MGGRVWFLHAMFLCFLITFFCPTSLIAPRFSLYPHPCFLQRNPEREYTSGMFTRRTRDQRPRKRSDLQRRPSRQGDRSLRAPRSLRRTVREASRPTGDESWRKPTRNMMARATSLGYRLMLRRLAALSWGRRSMVGSSGRDEALTKRSDEQVLGKNMEAPRATRAGCEEGASLADMD